MVDPELDRAFGACQIVLREAFKAFQILHQLAIMPVTTVTLWSFVSLYWFCAYPAEFKATIREALIPVMDATSVLWTAFRDAVEMIYSKLTMVAMFQFAFFFCIITAFPVVLQEVVKGLMRAGKPTKL